MKAASSYKLASEIAPSPPVPPPTLWPSKAELTQGTKTMQEATQLQLSPDGQSFYQPQSVSNIQDRARTLSPQPQHEPLVSRETLLQQHDKDKMVSRHIPHLRAMVESQAFKNVLVDEMDMMLSRAATLIQANWRGYQLRQKLISQMMAAKAIQEAWRRFNTRRLLRSGKLVEKKVSMEEGDIPYHAPQQVRFQHPGEGKPPLTQPVMVSKETQFPSSDSLAAYTHQLALLQSQSTLQPGMQAPCATRGPSVTFLPHQTVAIRLPCPVSLDTKCHPCLLTRPVRNACLVHVEGDMVKAKQVTARVNKAGAPGPPPCGRYAQAIHGSLKTQTQAHMEAEVLKAPPQTGPAPVMNKTPPQMYPVAAVTKTPPQPCPVPTVTIAKTPPQIYPVSRITKTPTQMYPAAAMTKTPPQTYPAAAMTKTPLQSCLAAMMNKTPPQPCSVPLVTITKAPPQTYPVAPVAKIPPQTCPVAAMAKTSPQASQPVTMIKSPLQSCLAAMVNKTPPQPCPAAPMSKTPIQMRPTASTTNTAPQTRPAAMMAKISPQICLLASMIKPTTQARPVAATTKTPPQTCPVPAVARTPTQMRPAAPMTKTPLQTCPAAGVAKTPSQTLPGATVTKTPPQTRLAAMVTKTPAQFRSMAAILRTLCLPPAAAGNLKSSPPAVAAAGIPNTSSHTYLNGPKAKAVVSTKQTAGMVKISSHSYLANGKVKYLSSHLGAGAPKATARPPLEAEKLKAVSQKQVKTETMSNTTIAIGMPRDSPWAKVAEDRSKSSLQTHLRTDVVKVQSQVYMPIETAVVLPQAQLATCPVKALPQTHLDTCLAKALPQERLATCSTAASSQGQLLAELTAALPRAHLGTCLAKTLSQAHPSAKLAKALSQGHPPVELTTSQAQAHLGSCLSKALSQAHSPAKLTKAPSFAHLGTCLTKAQSQAHLATGVMKVQSQAHLPTGLTKVQSQAQLVTETAKCLYAAHQPAELSNKTQSQPFLAGFKASTQPCQHVGALGPLPRPTPEDRLTQIQPHDCAQGKATQGPRQGVSEAQSMLVPLLASAGHPACNVESWGDSGATRTQSSMASPATPCQEDLATSQLASLCAELAAELGSQEDLRALLAKALSQGQVRAALNQALSKKVLGATMAKALPQGMLGAALMKVLSWGELGLALSRTLSPGELRAELTKAKQGKLADVLSKALTEEEWAALSQALCQGELGAVLSQSLSQAALRTGVFPKAASKTAGSRMTMVPAPVEVDYRGSPSAAWGPNLGPVRPQPSKVRVPQDRAWEGFVTGWPAGFLEEMGDGAMLGRSPCSSVVFMGASLASRVITTIHQYPLIAALDPTLSWEVEPSRASPNLYLSSEISGENACLAPGTSELASDLNPMESDTGPNLPKPPHLQLPPSLWQLLIANGVGPSTSQPSVAGGTVPSAHKPHVVSRVASRRWASTGEGKGASGTLPCAAGGGRAAHSQQCTVTYGRSVCWGQPSGINRVPPGVYRSSAAKVSQQPSVAREETTQKTPSPNHKRASAATRERTNKSTPGPLRAASMSKMSLTQPQIPKACDITLGLLPGSMVPGHRWAFKTQADPSVFPAPPGNKLAHTLTRLAVPRQERNRTQGTVASTYCPQERVTGHILTELVASLPQGPDNDLPGSLSQGSTDYGLNVSNSQSSLPSCSSLSLSSMSVASLTAVDLVEEESWEANLDGEINLDTLLSGEAVGRPQKPRDREETKKVGRGHTTPRLYHQPSAGSKLIPILHQSSVSGRVTLSVHWGSDDQDDGDVSSGQSSMGLKESLSQKSYRTGLTRSLSLDNVPTTHEQTSMATRLTSSLSQPSVVSKVAPNPGQPLTVSRVAPSPSELPVSGKVTPSLTEPSIASKVTLSLGQTSITGGVATNLARPSVTNAVAPNLAQASMTGGVVPSLAQPSVTSGIAPSLTRPSITGGVVPSLAQASVTGRVAPSLSQASVTGRVAPSLSQASVTGRVTPNLTWPSVTRGVAPSLAWPSVTHGVAPSLTQASATSGVSPSLARPSVTGGLAPNLVQASVTGGVAPSLAQGSMTGGVTPRLAQPSMTSGVAPSPARPSVTSGVAPSLAQASMTGGVTPSLAQASMTGGVAPSLTQLSVTSGVTPSLAQASMTGGVTPSLARPSVTSGVAPSLAQASVTSGVVPSLVQASVTSGVAPSLAQASMASGVTPSLARPSVTSGVTPSLVKPSMTDGVDPTVAQPPVTGAVAPSPAQASMACVVASSLSQPAVTGGVAPSLAHPSMIGGIAPSLGQPSVACVVAPSLGPPSVACVVVSTLAQPFVANRGPLSLFQPSVIGGAGCTVGQSDWMPKVGSNVPSRVDAVASSLHHPSFVTEIPAGTSCPPTTSSMGQDLNQSSVATETALCQEPVMVDGVASNPQAPEFNEVPLAFHQPLSVSGGHPNITEHSAVTLSAPNIYQTSGASGEDSCLDRGTSISPGALFRGMAASISPGAMAASMFPNMSRGTLAAGMFLSMSPGPMSPGMTGSVCQGSVTTGMGPNQFQVVSGMAPIAFPASVAGAPLIHEQATEVGPGFSPASVPNRLGMRPFRFSQANADPTMSQVNVDLPVSLNHQHPPVSTVVASGYQQADAFSQEPLMGTASGLVPGSVATRMPAALAPATAASGVAPSLPPGSVIRGVGQSLPPGPVISGVPPRLPPSYVISGVAPTFPAGSVICSISHSLPPGSVISGMGQGLPPEPMASAVAPSFPPGSAASREPPSLTAASGGGGKRQNLSMRPSVSFTAPSLIPGSVSNETDTNVSPGSVASSVFPTSVAGELNQGLVLGSTANAAGVPSTVRNVAQSLPQGSMLVGITPRPYHGALAGEGSIAPFQASHTTSLAQLHPQGLEASDTTRRGHQVPTVLQRASQLNHTLETMPFEATDDQAVMKPEGLDKGLSQVSISSGDSMVLDATPWMFHSPLSGDINDSHEFLPDSQRPLLEEVVPNQTESLTSGMAPVPPQPLNVANHSMAGSATPTLQQRSATSWRPPSSHFVTGSWVPSVLMESVRAPGAPLAQQASMAHIIPQSPLVAHIIPQSPSVAHIIPQSPPVAHIIPQSPSVAHIIPQSPSVVHIIPQSPPAAHIIPQSPSVAHIIPQSPTVTHIMSQDPPVTQVPQSPAYNMGASTIVSGSPKLAHSSPMAFSLHPGSITGMGTPSTSQRSGTTHKASHVSLYPSSTSGMASDGFQVAAVPRAHQKPVSGDLVQNNHKFLGSRKSYRSMHGYSISDMLDSNIAKVVPLHEVQEHTYRSSQESPKHSKSAPPVVTPIIRTTEVAHNTATSRLHPGLRRVSLGYESSPDGSRRPLLAQESMEGSLDFRSAGAPVDSDRASLTPTVLQGPVDAGIAGGQAWNSAVPSVAVGPMSSAVAPGGVWDLARASVPWDTVGREAAADPRQSGELVASMQAVEKIIIHAVVTIQACARGYLVRRTVKVWHQWAVIIQAAWRGYRVRRDLARLSRAATTIQAVWRGFLTRRPETQQTMLPAMWCKMGSRTRSGSDHRCFQSCQPHICALCQSLSPRLGSPPSVVMLVGSSPRTCHMCGHTLPTRVVHGMGRGSIVQAGLPWGCATQMNSRSPRLSCRRIKAATAIQSAWRGFSVRRRLKQQQMAAKMLQATWRGHRTRASLTMDALLGPAAWDSSQHMQWPGV